MTQDEKPPLMAKKLKDRVVERWILDHQYLFPFLVTLAALVLSVLVWLAWPALVRWLPDPSVSPDFLNIFSFIVGVLTVLGIAAAVVQLIVANQTPKLEFRPCINADGSLSVQLENKGRKAASVWMLRLWFPEGVEAKPWEDQKIDFFRYYDDDLRRFGCTIRSKGDWPITPNELLILGNIRFKGLIWSQQLSVHYFLTADGMREKKCHLKKLPQKEDHCMLPPGMRDKKVRDEMGFDPKFTILACGDKEPKR